MPLVRLADLLDQNTANSFVGREAELEMFRSVIVSRDTPLHLIYLHGGRRIGKTSLLAAWTRLARREGAHVVLMSAKSITPTEVSVQAAIEEAVRRSSPGGFWSLIKDIGQRWVLIIDDYHQLGPVDRWLREEFIPELPASCLVVLSSRRPPEPAWRSNLGWTGAMQAVALDGLSREACDEYCAKMGLCPEWQAKVHAFSEGHPLAMTLACDLALRHPDGEVDLNSEPQILRPLTTSLLPPMDTNQRRALFAASLMRYSCRDSLGAVLEGDLQALYAWLERLDFVTTYDNCLQPSNLLRRIANAEMIRRDARNAHAIREKVGRYFKQRTLDPSIHDGLLDWLYLQGQHPEWGRIQAAPGIEHVMVESAIGSDRQAIVSLVTQTCGPSAAAMVGQLLFSSSTANLVCRQGRELCGFVQILETKPGSEPLAPNLSGLAGVRSLAESLSAPVLLVRAFSSTSGGCEDAATHLALAMHVVQRALNHPNAARLVIVSPEPEVWSSCLSLMNLQPLSVEDAEKDQALIDLSIEILCYDLERASLPVPLGMGRGEQHRVGIRAEAPEMSGEALEAAVRAALKDFHDEPKLKANLLLASCLVKCMAGGHSAKPTPKKSIASLKNMLRDTVGELAGHPRRGKQARLLDHTYLEPLGSQEDVAEHMSMSMSTFRRHLKAAVASVSAGIGTRIEECRANCRQMSGQGAPEHVQIQCEPEQPTIDRRGQSDRRKRSCSSWRPPCSKS